MRKTIPPFSSDYSAFITANVAWQDTRASHWRSSWRSVLRPGFADDLATISSMVRIHYLKNLLNRCFVVLRFLKQPSFASSYDMGWDGKIMLCPPNWWGPLAICRIHGRHRGMLFKLSGWFMNVYIRSFKSWDLETWKYMEIQYEVNIVKIPLPSWNRRSILLVVT